MTSVPWKKLYSKIAPRVQIAPKVFYEIVWVEKFPENKDKVGETRPSYHQIVLKTNETAKDTVSTYLHEILHSVSDTYDVGLTETQVQKLEKALPYILKTGNVFKE